MEQQDQIKLFYNLFNHNQETVYFGSYDMSFNPYITDEGKLKYENKVDGIFQTRHIKSPLKIEFLADHLVVNKLNSNCDENGLIHNKLMTDYGKPVVTTTKVGDHDILDQWDHGIVLQSLGPDGKGVFGAIDVDIYDDQKLLERVVKQIYTDNIPLVPCFSKSGGLHLYLFSKEPFEYFEIDNALKHFRKLLNIKAKEIFPKQAYKPKRFGNGIALPYRSTVLRYGNNFRLDFHKAKNVFIKEDLSLGKLDEFLVQAQEVKNIWTDEYWKQIPIMQPDKKETKVKETSVINIADFVRGPSKAVGKILDNILQGKEHKEGGTFDNWVLNFVYCCVKVDKRTDDEIKSYFDEVKHKSDKADIDNYIEDKISNCRSKYKQSDPGNELSDFAENIVWDMETDKFFDLRTNKPLSPVSLNRKFNQLFSQDTRPTFEFDNYEGKLIVEAKLYRPDLYDQNNRIISEGPCTYLNKYRPGNLKPIKPTMGDLKPYLELMGYLFPVEKERKHVEDYLAFIVQNPGVKIRHAILVYSKDYQIGKGSLFEVMTDILGEENAEPGSVKSILDKGVSFTEKLFVLIDECRNAGDYNENKKLLNDLKIIITEQRIQKRLLYSDYGTTKQFTNFIIFTNNEDALSIDDKDARYFVTENLEPRKEQSFYKNFHIWRKDKGSSYVMDYLLNRDLSKFDHTKPAPDTAAKSKMSKSSSHTLQQDMEDKFNEGKQPFAFTDSIKGTSEIKEWYKKYGSITHQKAVSNPKTVSKCLENLGFYRIGQVLQKSTNQKPMLWIVRNINSLKARCTNSELCNDIWKPLNLYENDFEIREQKSMEHFQKESNKPENVQRFINLGNVDEAKERMAAGLPEDENIGPNN